MNESKKGGQSKSNKPSLPTNVASPISDDIPAELENALRKVGVDPRDPNISRAVEVSMNDDNERIPPNCATANPRRVCEN